MTKRISTYILLGAYVIDLFVPFILSFYYPGYNAAFDTISTLGTKASPVAVWENLALISVGILYTLFGQQLTYLFTSRDRPSKNYVKGIIAFGLGSVLAGIFPEDVKGLEVESISSKIHGISSFIGFLGLIFCPYWATKIKQINTPSWVNYVFLVSGIFTFVLFLSSEKKEYGFFQFTGLYQRINLIILYLALWVNFKNTETKP